MSKRNDGLTSHDRITLSEAKRRLAKKKIKNSKGEEYSADAARGGMSKSRYQRMLRRGHQLLDWMREGYRD